MSGIQGASYEAVEGLQESADFSARVGDDKVVVIGQKAKGMKANSIRFGTVRECVRNNSVCLDTRLEQKLALCTSPGDEIGGAFEDLSRWRGHTSRGKQIGFH